MNIYKKVLTFSLVLFSLGFMNNALAARSCSVYVKDITLEPYKVQINTINSVTYNNNDILTLSYQDENFDTILEKLVQAKNWELQVKVYILEEFDGDDANSCSDGVIDYVGSVHNI
ncbi:hypothetical protein [Pseudoalteromonas sp. PB2-1]|uniref:hypothetical protein n=1 Tax=Pseudoalteromonas sp. PB2-1 TaxID=2907242 RepID=UPI003703892A